MLETPIIKKVCVPYFKPYFDLEIIYKLKPTDFKPIPSVNSVLLHISKRKKALINKTKLIYIGILLLIYLKEGIMRERCKYILAPNN